MVILGIDLGTTFSAAAYVDEQGRVVVIEIGDAKWLSSVVLIRNRKVVVGDAAMNEWITDEEHVVRWIKRSIGDRDYQFPRTLLFSAAMPAPEDLDAKELPDELRGSFQSHGRPLSAGALVATVVPRQHWLIHEPQVSYILKKRDGELDVYEGLSAVDISAEILKAVKSHAEKQLGYAVTEVVITCPAYFNTQEIENTKRAGELAGFRVVREIIEEPVAAAVHYGVEHMKSGQKILVCDLGGGTFDATVLTLDGRVFKPLATMGDRRLGGHDWTMELVDLVAERCCDLSLDDPRNDLVGRQALYENCEKAKRDFASMATQSVICQCAGQLQQVTIQREEFEARTEWLIQNMTMWCQQAMEKANLSWNQIDTILMVGGSSRLRRMGEALEKLSGRKPVLSSSPDLAVACGAAIMAKGKVRARRPAAGLTDASPTPGLTDVLWTGTIPRSLGTRAYDPDTKLITNALILPQGTEIPVSKSSDDFEVSCDGQELFDIPIVEFENDADYETIRNYRFRCPSNVRQGDAIRVTFRYDRSKILTADAHHLASGKALTGEETPYREPQVSDFEIRIKPRWVVFALDVSGSMSGEKIKSAKQALLENARSLIGAGGKTCKVGVVSFSNAAEVVCQPTNDLDLLAGHIAGMAADGLTAMDDGINLAVNLVAQAPCEYDRDVVLLTDGNPDSHRKDSTLRAARTAHEKGITLSMLGIGRDGVDLAYLQSLTPLTLQITSAQDIGGGVNSLLTKASSHRSKLTDKRI